VNQQEITQNGFFLKNKKSINSLLTNELSARKPNHPELDKFRASAGLGGPDPLMPAYVAYNKAVYRLQAQFGRRNENTLKIQEPGAIARK
jgi:hypothetical protein